MKVNSLDVILEDNEQFNPEEFKELITTITPSFSALNRAAKLDRLLAQIDMGIKYCNNYIGNGSDRYYSQAIEYLEQTKSELRDMSTLRPSNKTKPYGGK